MIRFHAQQATLDAAAPDADAPRTITGIAVPWDVAATVSDGTPVKFLRGAFDVNQKPAKLIENHDMTQLRGTVTELVDAEDGLLFTARFAKTTAADQAIELVKAGAYDAVSVGAQPIKFKYDKEGTMVVSEARLLELSLVPYGAFEEAVITEIAASAEEEEIPTPAEEVGNTDPQDTPKENEDMTEQTPVAVEASIPTAPLPAQPKREFKMPTPGEVLAGGQGARRVDKDAPPGRRGRPAHDGHARSVERPGARPAGAGHQLREADRPGGRGALVSGRRQDEDVYPPDDHDAHARRHSGRRAQRSLRPDDGHRR